MILIGGTCIRKHIAELVDVRDRGRCVLSTGDCGYRESTFCS